MHFYMDTVVVSRHPDAVIRSNAVRPPHIADPADLFDPITYQKVLHIESLRISRSNRITCRRRT